MNENVFSRLQKQDQQSDAAQYLTQTAVDRCKTGIAWIRPDGRIFYANESACQQLGYSEEEILTLSVSDIDPDWPPDFWQTGWEQIKAAKVMTFETRNKHRDGHIFPVEITTNHIEHDGNEYVFAFITDITDRKEAEKALQESETKLRVIFDHHYQLTGLLDCEGRILAANKTALDFAGAEKSQVLGMYFWKSPWWDESQESQLRNGIQQAANGEFVRYESKHVRADGQIRDFDFSLSPIEDNDGNVIFIVPEGRDITEIKQAEKQLHENNAMIRDLVETSQDWIWAIDLEGVYTYCNSAITSILGYQPDEIVDQKYFEFIHDQDRELFVRTFANGTTTKKGWNGLVARWRHKNGSWRYLESNAAAIGETGELLGFRGVDRDITDRLMAEQKLSSMEAQLAHVGRLSAMGEMTAGIVHEVAQPLFSISNFARAAANVLENSDQPSLQDLTKWNEDIINAVNQADEIIRRMRTFARRNGSQRTRCRINDILCESVQLVASYARESGAKVNLLLPNPSHYVKVDRVQIQQVVVILLRNSFEAMRENECPTREVTLGIEPVEQAIRISVTDTGPGLPTIENSTIFEPFQTTKKNGLGLGLAISSSIIEAHKGGLWAESPANGGAVFYFTLPVVPAESKVDAEA